MKNSAAMHYLLRNSVPRMRDVSGGHCPSSTLASDFVAQLKTIVVVAI
ncbi:hypothetical protein MMMB2_4929 [Mycobacterium marinum MB2]|nr:hypothetical protein MMMB2_4929 [Mycobacterium marinum MB2]